MSIRMTAKQARAALDTALELKRAYQAREASLMADLVEARDQRNKYLLLYGEVVLILRGCVDQNADFENMTDLCAKTFRNARAFLARTEGGGK